MHGQGAAMLGLHVEAGVASAGVDTPWLLAASCVATVARGAQLAPINGRSFSGI
jgi:hypothetical protein